MGRSRSQNPYSSGAKEVIAFAESINRATGKEAIGIKSLKVIFAGRGCCNGDESGSTGILLAVRYICNKMTILN